MAEYCTNRSVFEAALDRIRYCYDNFDEVIVNVSGGKDSTICLELAIMVAREKGKTTCESYVVRPRMRVANDR